MCNSFDCRRVKVWLKRWLSCRRPSKCQRLPTIELRLWTWARFVGRFVLCYSVLSRTNAWPRRETENTCSIAETDVDAEMRSILSCWWWTWWLLWFRKQPQWKHCLPGREVYALKSHRARLVDRTVARGDDMDSTGELWPDEVAPGCCCSQSLLEDLVLRLSLSHSLSFL